MPIYEYRCDDCGASFEAFQKMSDDPMVECEACGGPLRKVLHPVAIHFKGSGFYTTDYGKGSSRRPGGRETASGDGGESSGAESGSSSGTDSGSSSGAESGSSNGAKPGASPASSDKPASSGDKAKEKQKST